MHASSRRRFLKHAMGGAAGALAAPSALRAAVTAIPDAPARSLPPPPHGAIENEPFWELVKEQFPLAPGLILMNAANLCPSPYPVQEAVFRLTRDVDADASFQNRAKFGDLREQSRAALASYLGASPDEIAIPRNTSEGNNTVLNGLDLGAGDEVVIWDENHPTNNISWDVRAERWGFTVRRVSTPPAAATAEELIAAFEGAITDRTRVLAFSHISNVSGVALPAKDLCRLASDAGILTLVDGAQSFGALQVDLHAMGCDFYTGSAHKWFVGPKEAGVLYVREERIPELWASDVGVGWAGALEGGARKFDNLGQRDDAAVSAVGTAVRFHEAIGAGLIEERVRALETRIREVARERIPGVEFLTSDEADRRAGVVVVRIPGADHPALYRRLYDEHRIGCALRGGEFEGIRLCPHIYNTMEEVERVVDAMTASRHG
jgi:selenocysteine lyase/cysteine desulfurase